MASRSDQSHGWKEIFVRIMHALENISYWLEMDVRERRSR